MQVILFRVFSVSFHEDVSLFDLFLFWFLGNSTWDFFLFRRNIGCRLSTSSFLFNFLRSTDLRLLYNLLLYCRLSFTFIFNRLFNTFDAWTFQRNFRLNFFTALLSFWNLILLRLYRFLNRLSRSILHFHFWIFVYLASLFRFYFFSLLRKMNFLARSHRSLIQWPAHFSHQLLA